MSKFLTAQKIREKYDVNPQTLRNWAVRGKVTYQTIDHDKRKTWLYDINSVGKLLESKNGLPTPVLPRVLYARVSSKKQQADLERQIEILSKRYPDTEIISDIGSGLNDQRRGFRRLVERVCRGEISEIVVTYKDRLLRFGYELFEQVCKEHGVSIVVWSKENNLQDITGTDQELQDDLLSVINVFVAKRNGIRAGQLKKARTKQHEEDSDLSE